jgi:hypothetical protein
MMMASLRTSPASASLVSQLELAHLCGFRRQKRDPRATPPQFATCNARNHFAQMFWKDGTFKLAIFRERQSVPLEPLTEHLELNGVHIRPLGLVRHKQ